MKKITMIFLLFSLLAYGKEYNIGDNITLKIQGDISKNQIEKAFKPYENVDITKSNNEYIVSFTSYKVGVNKIKIGNTNLKINIKSNKLKTKLSEVARLSKFIAFLCFSGRIIASS